MKLEKMTAERQSNMYAAPHKMAWAAIATSVVFHAVGFAALATWTTSPRGSHVRFAGREQAFQLTLSFAQPQWEADPATLDDYQTDPPVVIEPNKARISKHTYVHAPTFELSADDLLLDSPIDSTQRLPELVALNEVRDLDEVYEVATQPAPSPPSVERQQTKPQASHSAVAVPPSQLGNAEDIPPDLSQNMPPTYPAHAIRNGWEGTVLLRVWIDETGRVTKVEVLRTSGYRVLDGAAVSAVRQWVAVPANRGGKSVATVELLPVHFKLRADRNSPWRGPHR